MECLFCKIAKGEIPCFKVYEDYGHIAFLDINYHAKGHCLIIPKKHYENILDTPDGALKKIIPIVKKVSIAVKKALKADGITILNRNGIGAHQHVPHLHIHVIPRFVDDNIKEFEQFQYKEKEFEVYADKIKKLL